MPVQRAKVMTLRFDRRAACDGRVATVTKDPSPYPAKPFAEPAGDAGGRTPTA